MKKYKILLVVGIALTCIIAGITVHLHNQTTPTTASKNVKEVYLFFDLSKKECREVEPALDRLGHELIGKTPVFYCNMFEPEAMPNFCKDYIKKYNLPKDKPTVIVVLNNHETVVLTGADKIRKELPKYLPNVSFNEPPIIPPACPANSTELAKLYNMLKQEKTVVLLYNGYSDEFWDHRSEILNIIHKLEHRGYSCLPCPLQAVANIPDTLDMCFSVTCKFPQVWNYNVSLIIIDENKTIPIYGYENITKKIKELKFI